MYYISFFIQKKNVINIFFFLFAFLLQLCMGSSILITLSQGLSSIYLLFTISYHTLFCPSISSLVFLSPFFFYVYFHSYSPKYRPMHITSTTVTTLVRKVPVKPLFLWLSATPTMSLIITSRLLSV